MPGERELWAIRHTENANAIMSFIYGYGNVMVRLYCAERFTMRRIECY